MIRRFVRRVVIAGFCLSFLLAGSVGVACLLAVSAPSYYAKLVATHPSGGKSEAVEQRFEEIQADFRQWQTRSLRLQHANANRGERTVGFRLEADPDYDPSTDLYTVRVGQDELNALLASDDFRISGGQLTDLRVELRDGRFTVACSLATPAGPVVLSAGFAARDLEDDTLRLRLESVRVGRLPLPVELLDSWLPKQRSRLSGDLYLDTTGDAPELSLRLPEARGASPRTKSVACVDGAVVVQLTPALLPRD
ncbi:hypothetical protein [Botrimarina sp.]|uniref:hypothetical protein n=1 Tax=Botrimarina sp. TaxID=2795802 RepID=UPI0032EEEB61